MTVKAGVIGVGTMGRHHARVYSNLQEARLVGVCDADDDVAAKVAENYGTKRYSEERLIEEVDAVSIAVPTRHHYEVARRCIEADVDVLVEKPFVEDLNSGRELIELAEKGDVLIQVGHIERFNPAVQALENILPDLDVIAYEARRLGPDPRRDIQDSVVMDLMIHDLDIIMSLQEEKPVEVQANGTRSGKHASASLSFEGGEIASLLTSRVTQQKIRELRITTEECYVHVDYLDGDVEIHRDSAPEYVSDNEEVRYRHESVIERPVVENSEPLRNELSSFVGAIESAEDPEVSAEDALAALELTSAVEKEAFPGGG